MKVRISFGLATMAALVLVGGWVTGLRGQGDLAAPVIGPPTGNGNAQRAAGKALLQGQPKWSVPVSNNFGKLYVLGPNLLYVPFTGRGGGGAGGGGAPGGGGVVPTGPTLLDRNTGRVLWQAAGITIPASDGPGHIDLTKEGIEFCERWPGQLNLVRLSTDAGVVSTVWQTAFKGPAAEVNGPSVQPAPILSDQQVIIGETYGSMMSRALATDLAIKALDRKTGQAQWEIAVPEKAFSATVQVAQGRVYVTVITLPAQVTPSVMPQGFLMALDAATGKLIWKTDKEALASQAAVFGKAVVVLTQDGAAVAYDVENGKQKWRTALSDVCDPDKSKVGTLRTAGGIFMVKDRLVATFDQFMYETPAPGGFGAGRNQVTTLNVSEIAYLGPGTGKQTGYFSTDGIRSSDMSTALLSPLMPAVETYKDLLLVKFDPNGRCLGIDLNTLKLKWEIDAIWTTADGVLYTVARQQQGNVNLVAIPLDAGDDAKKAEKL